MWGFHTHHRDPGWPGSKPRFSQTPSALTTELSRCAIRKATSGNYPGSGGWLFSDPHWSEYVGRQSVGSTRLTPHTVSLKLLRLQRFNTVQLDSRKGQTTLNEWTLIWSCLLFSTKKRTTFVAIPGYFASICDVTSKSVCLTLRLEIADPYAHVNGDYQGV